MTIPITKISHTYSTFTTNRGARIFRLPLEAFPGFWAYAYLVIASNHRVLIDTGSGFGKSNAMLEAGFERASRDLAQPIGFEDLTHILISHGHIDHFGGLAILRERTNAKVGVHELDLRNLTNYEERIAVIARRLESYLVEAGVSGDRRSELLNMYRINKALFHSVPVDFTFQACGMEVGPFQMLHVPGHCAGHVVIRLDDVLFTGDHILDVISPHQSPERLTLYTGLGHYLDSLTGLMGWANGVSLTLGGHNDPIISLSGRIEEIRAVHNNRLEQVLEILEQPHTIVEVSDLLFGTLSGYDSLLAVEETGAHVEYLYQRGLLSIVNTEELDDTLHPISLYYRRLHDPVSAQLLI